MCAMIGSFSQAKETAVIDKRDLEAFADGAYDTAEAREIWKSYLKKYLGNADWSLAVGSLWNNIQRKNGTDEDLYNQIAAAILMPAIDRSIRIDPNEPQRFLFGCASFPGFGADFKKFKKDSWIGVMRDVVGDDVRNILIRQEAIQLGFIEKIEYQPMSRQALRWLKEKAVESGVELTDNEEAHYRELVQSYGGALICNIFTRHDNRIKEVLNWHTPYFFERLIQRIYTPEQIFNIKTKELDENPRLVTKVDDGF